MFLQTLPTPGPHLEVHNATKLLLLLLLLSLLLSLLLFSFNYHLLLRPENIGRFQIGMHQSRLKLLLLYSTNIELPIKHICHNFQTLCSVLRATRRSLPNLFVAQGDKPLRPFRKITCVKTFVTVNITIIVPDMHGFNQ